MPPLVGSSQYNRFPVGSLSGRKVRSHPYPRRGRIHTINHVNLAVPVANASTQKTQPLHSGPLQDTPAGPITLHRRGVHHVLQIFDHVGHPQEEAAERHFGQGQISRQTSRMDRMNRVLSIVAAAWKLSRPP
jgi:hypothetical protein